MQLVKAVAARVIQEEEARRKAEWEAKRGLDFWKSTAAGEEDAKRKEEEAAKKRAAAEAQAAEVARAKQEQAQRLVSPERRGNNLRVLKVCYLTDTDIIWP